MFADLEKSQKVKWLYETAGLTCRGGPRFISAGRLEVAKMRPKTCRECCFPRCIRLVPVSFAMRMWMYMRYSSSCHHRLVAQHFEVTGQQLHRPAVRPLDPARDEVTT
ncbi:hypothetical protein F443_15725 [Phytophthora nicotianae P1569]|uniref:Uncharacterized protein n=1 Tax=Phytophthora nicotianae P1569 TaxID=1317065 RepID=V9EHW6_PHYNI|nr:hypothetical protein F443_15725 [Phytophthora nicotianae P1569]